MNREIKFRGKRLDNGEWVYGDLMRNTCGTRIVHYEESKDKAINRVVWDYVDVDPVTVGQYTGLKDVNGVEIYEGDILVYGRHHKHVVEFKHGMFGYMLMDGWFIGYGGNPNFTFNPLDRSDEHEVIGNIHDQGKEVNNESKD